MLRHPASGHSALLTMITDTPSRPVLVCLLVIAVVATTAAASGVGGLRGGSPLSSPAQTQLGDAAPATAATEGFCTERWGEALKTIGEMVGVPTSDPSVRLVSPMGGLGFSHEWPSTPAATQVALDRNIPWEHCQAIGLLASTSEWYGDFLGMCDPPKAIGTEFNTALLNYLAARHRNGSEAVKFPWSVSMSREQWLEGFANGRFRSAVDFTQEGVVTNSTGGVLYHFHDLISASSIVLVDAAPAGDWFDEGILGAMKGAQCPGFGAGKTTEAFFSPQSGFLNSLTTGFVVMTNVTIHSVFTEPDGGTESSTVTSTRPVDPFVVAYVQKRLP